MPSSQVKPKAFLDQCVAIVSKYVECHDPLMYEVIDEEKVMYALCNSNTKITMEGYPLFYLLKVKNSKGLYLHVDATIKAPERGASLERNHDFEGISLQFLQGTGNLFCRAEWDVKKKNDKLTHPQPHWHWGYVGKEEEFDLFNPTETDAIPEGGFMQEIVDNTSTLPNIDFEELHYAMAARWTVQDSAVEEFTVQRLQTWMKNCIKNVIDQYNYQVNKGGFVSSKEW